jgi:hypothetical protein
MSLIVAELYDALLDAGVDDNKARAAAAAGSGSDARADLATKAHLAELKADLIKWNVGTPIAMTGLFTACESTLTKLFRGAVVAPTRSE